MSCVISNGRCSSDEATELADVVFDVENDYDVNMEIELCKLHTNIFRSKGVNYFLAKVLLGIVRDLYQRQCLSQTIPGYS